MIGSTGCPDVFSRVERHAYASDWETTSSVVLSPLLYRVTWVGGGVLREGRTGHKLDVIYSRSMSDWLSEHDGIGPRSFEPVTIFFFEYGLECAVDRATCRLDFLFLRVGLKMVYAGNLAGSFKPVTIHHPHERPCGGHCWPCLGCTPSFNQSYA